MRSCGSSSSPTAHITFCTLTEVFRPQILIMALPSLTCDGRFVVPAIHRFVCAENKTRVAAQGSADPATRWSCKARCKEQSQNKGNCTATSAHTQKMRTARARGGRVRTTKKPG